jgi:predicted alpha/beta-hydrolase family hydrolase
MPEPIRIDVTATEHATAIVYPALRERAGITLILAHGAGANQASAFMVRFASALAERGIDTVTFNFLYTEARRRVPDRNDKLESCWRKMISAFHAGRFGIGGKLAVGGKSMGGRIASQVAAAPEQTDAIAGLVLLGYPLHPPGQPDKLRTAHLPAIRTPMLIVQGARDSFGTPEELKPVLAQLKMPVDLFVVEGGDHSFKVAKKAVPPQEEVYERVLDKIDQWLRGLSHGKR